MKEHSGGPPPSAFITVNHWEDHSFEVHPVFMPDPAANDRLSDMLREVEERGEDAVAFILSTLRPHIYEMLWTGLRRINSLLDGTRNQRLARDQMRWVDGSALMDGQTLGQLARRHGVSKQAFQQGCKTFREVLEIRSQSARTPEACSKMRKRNGRRFKHEGTQKAK